MKYRLFAILCLAALILTVFPGLAPKGESDSEAAFPPRYDLRELGYVTEPKNQDVYGTCWAFAIANVLECNAFVRGFGEYDVSEYQLAYTCMHIAPNAVSGAESEGPKCSGNWLTGPYAGIMSSSLLKGCAIRTEEEFPYSGIEDPLPEDGFSADGALYVDSCYTVPASDTNAMKTLIMQNGALLVNVCAMSWMDESGEYCDWDTGAAYLPEYTSKYPNIDHFVSIVGWDDDYSKDNFRTTPPGDGAWIVKNSLGSELDEPVPVGDHAITKIGDDGFFYVSYYDADFNRYNSATSITVRNERDHDRIYQYDGGVGLLYAEKVTDVVMRFTAEENESITGVRIKPSGALFQYSFYCGDWKFEETAASISVFKGAFDAESAEDAEPLYTQQYTVVYPDYQTVGFDTEVELTKGEEYWVRVAFDKPVYYALDGNQFLFYSYQNTAGGTPGETYLKIENGDDDGEWYDTVKVPGKSIPCSACIKVLTKDRELPPPEEEPTPVLKATETPAETDAAGAPSGRFPPVLFPVIAASAAAIAAIAVIAIKKGKKTNGD